MNKLWKNARNLLQQRLSGLFRSTSSQPALINFGPPYF